MKKNIPLLTLLSLCICIYTFAQSPFINILGNTSNNKSLEEARKIIRTPDGRFLVVGYVADSTSSLNRDALAFVIDSAGSIIWQKKYGGSNFEEFSDVIYLGGYYYCVGYTRSWVHGSFGTPNVNADVFLVKLNLDGTLVWAKNMGRPSAGTSATDGNDQGLSLTGSIQGGVIINVRINSGNTSNQNTGILSIDANAKTRWAYQYDTPHISSANELTAGIWKDGSHNYITGGWVNNFSGITGGFLFKVNNNGDLLWSRNTRISPGVFESQYYGYYNNANGKIYATDLYDQTVTSIREPVVITNLSSTGAVPTGGGIPRVRRFYYGSPNNSSDNFRGILVPTGDGQSEFMLAYYNLNTPNGTTQYATVASMTTNLVFQWSKKIGVANVTNQINDIITCEGANKDLIAVGSVLYSNGSKDILISRFAASGTPDACNTSDNVSSDTLNVNSTNYALTRLNLNTSGCTSCWADNSTINSVSVNTASLSLISNCVSMMLTAPINNITSSVCADASCPQNLQLTFASKPKELYFDLTDITGNFVYDRFYVTDPLSINLYLQKLSNGYNFTSMGLNPGDYIWEAEAIYDGIPGMERKVGSIKMQ